mmetsp:Transcript_25626/g.67737  ORF Transcript_25626/g.67737 Transcript_25626/m.67737 type:complete len:230 (+) Transcript_25626:539-1228(+)
MAIIRCHPLLALQERRLQILVELRRVAVEKPERGLADHPLHRVPHDAERGAARVGLRELHVPSGGRVPHGAPLLLVPPLVSGQARELAAKAPLELIGVRTPQALVVHAPCPEAARAGRGGPQGHLLDRRARGLGDVQEIEAPATLALQPVQRLEAHRLPRAHCHKLPAGELQEALLASAVGVLRVPVAVQLQRGCCRQQRAEEPPGEPPRHRRSRFVTWKMEECCAGAA